MKTLILFLLLPTCAFTQSNTRQYMFKMSPQHLTLNMLKVGVERLNKDQSKSLSVYLYGTANDRNQSYSGFPYLGGGSQIQAQKYLNSFALKTTANGQQISQSIYLAGFIQGGIFRWNNDEPFIGQPNRRNFDKNVAAGFTMGFQRTFLEVLVIDLYAGAGFQKGWSDASLATPIRWTYNNDRFSGPGYTGILPKVGLQIGVVL